MEKKWRALGAWKPVQRGAQMGKTIVLFLAAAMLVTVMAGTRCEAGSVLTFVSRTGSGTACTASAPCASVQLAYAATDPNGVIRCVDGDDPLASSLTIGKSLTVDCPSSNW